MNFYNNILELYSGDFDRMQNVISNSIHRMQIQNIYEKLRGVHTGFYFKTQHGRTMELIYALVSEEFVYQQMTSNEGYWRSLGEVMELELDQSKGDDYYHFRNYFSDKDAYNRNGGKYPDIYYKYLKYDVNLMTFDNCYSNMISNRQNDLNGFNFYEANEMKITIPYRKDPKIVTISI